MDDQEKYEGWVSDSILKQFGIEKQHVDKAKEILDMLEIDDEKIVINVGDNIQIKITK